MRRFGPYFEVEVHPPGTVPSEPWRGLVDLVDDPTVLSVRIDAVGVALADRVGLVPGGLDVRVSASTAHLGLVARVIAAALGLVVTGEPTAISLAGTWWQDRLGGPVPLSLAWPGDPGPDPNPVTTLLAEVLDPLTSAVHVQAGVPNRSLWGNVASAAASAARLITTADPARSDAAWAWVRALLGDPRLAGEPGPAGPSFRRGSCCLIYRAIPGPARAGALCGDCVLG